MSKFDKYEKEYYNIDKPSFINSERIGKVGECYVRAKLLEHNIPVFNPNVDDGVDIIAQFNDEFKTIQIKTSTRTSEDGLKTIFDLRRISTTIKNGKRYKRYSRYSKDEVDYFALYDATSNDIYLVKNDGKMASFIVNKHPKAKKLKTSNYAEDHEIDNVLKKISHGNYNGNKKSKKNNKEKIVMIGGIDF